MIKAFLFAMSCAAPVAAQDIFILGEVHDNPAHHLEQASRIAQIAPSAVVFEMLEPSQASIANRERGAADLAEKLGWADAGWPDFAMYQPVFDASPATVYGAALPYDTVRAAIATNAATVFGDGAVDYGLTELDDATRDALVQEQADAHCGMLPPEMLPGMVEAQRLRDAAFARATIDAFDQTGGPVVLITGNGHARTDRGVPTVIAKARPDLTVFALGQLEAPEENAPFDEVRITDPVEREDPCAAFK